MEILRTCKICNINAYTTEDLEGFKKDVKGKYGRANYHSSCYSKHKSSIYKYKDSKKEWRKNNPEKNKILIKRAQVKNTYGVTLEEYNKAMRTSNVCEVCHTTKNLCYDHSHIKPKNIEAFRGILCNKCNTAAGMMGDKAEEVYKLYLYLVHRGD